MCWFYLDREWLQETFCTREPDFYKQLYKMNTARQEMYSYQISFFPVVNNQIIEELELQARNDSVTQTF